MSATKKKLKIATTPVLFLLLFVLSAAYAHAGWLGDILGIGNIVGGVIGWFVYVVTYIFASIAGIAIALISYFVEIVLQLNTHIPEALMVQKGFAVMLALANLGFVLGIIVIAIATILRRQTYGIKQLLWKLIVMAILVNFSLVIASAILSFADQLALFFLNNINPAGAGSGGAVNPFHNFAAALAGAFTPQRGFLTIAITGDEPSAQLADSQRSLSGAAGQSLANIIAPLISLFFVVLFLVLVVVALAGFLVMILIRYVALCILLILMPFAWMCWVFPNLSSYWQKWWHSFVRWTFFAPVVVFFLYLAILTADAMNSVPAGKAPLSALGAQEFESTADNAVVSGISNFFGNYFATLAGTMLRMTAMLGLVVGGLIAANSIGITFAKEAYGAAKGVGKTFGGWTARKGGGVLARAATRPPPGTAGYGASGWNRFTYGLTAPLRWGARVLPAATRGRMHAWGSTAAASPGLASSIWNGMLTGSGLYRRPQRWQCLACRNITSHKGHPPLDFPCPNCHVTTNSERTRLANPSYDNWQQV